MTARERYEKRLKEFLKDHQACPKCNRTRFRQTLRGVIWNYLTCKCGWEGSIGCLVKKK